MTNTVKAHLKLTQIDTLLWLVNQRIKALDKIHPQTDELWNERTELLAIRKELQHAGT